MEHNFNKMGSHSVGDLAHTDLKRLERTFGVIGTQCGYKNKSTKGCVVYGTDPTSFCAFIKY